MKIKLIAAVMLISALSGCASQKVLTPTGGSRADGTVKMSFEHGAFEVPKIDTVAGAKVAAERCAAWGYSGAEPFGGQTSQCVNSSMGSCNRWMVTYEYQCTGNPPASRM